MPDNGSHTTFMQSLSEISGRNIGSVVLIGFFAGLGATFFHYLADRLGVVIFAWIESNSYQMRLPLVVLVPTLGLFAIGIVLEHFPEGRRGGVREVWESLGRHGGVIPWRRGLYVFLSALVLAFGGSVGPEGPMVQLGALIGSKVGKLFARTEASLRTMVRAGAAAGIAGAFSSPAGGILLTIEVFGAGFDRAIPVIGIAAVIGYLTRTALLGREYPFVLPYTPEPLPLTGILVLAPLMGLLAAPSGHLFIRLFRETRRVFPQRWRLSVRVGLGGLLVGGIGILYPQVMSAGYPVVEKALLGEYGVRMLLILLVLKMVATSITFGSGAVGGLFAPTLFIGAMYGGAFGFAVHALFPEVAPQPEVYILLGMVVMFGSIVKGYWSGLLLAADMSGAYHVLLLPGIIAGGMSFLLSWKMHDRSIFDLPLASGAEGAKAPGGDDDRLQV